MDANICHDLLDESPPVAASEHRIVGRPLGERDVQWLRTAETRYSPVSCAVVPPTLTLMIGRGSGQMEVGDS